MEQDDTYKWNNVTKLWNSFNTQAADEKFDNCTHTLNFKNGIYNLKTSEFRERIKEDYVTKCLPFDYSPQVNDTIKNKIMDILLKISNNNKELLEFNLNWLGYCLTGETDEHKFLLLDSKKASGKSTMAKMFINSLPIYSAKIDRRTFATNYKNAYKQLSQIQKPVRFVCIEEFDKTKLDVDKFCAFIDGTIEPKKAGPDIKLHCKLLCTSSKDYKFTNKDIKKRVILETLVSEFLEKHDYNVLKNNKNVYLQEKDINSNFENNNDYKLTYIQILMEYANKYYRNGLDVPKNINKL
jgi:hypothetical protein